jgi:hypothetical protein
MKRIDLRGRTFGRWRVLGWSHTDRRGATYWHCRCEDGVERAVRASHLVDGSSKSCGCLRREQCGNMSRRHGLSRGPDGKVTRLYAAWTAMRQRCNNPNHRFYYCYGGREDGSIAVSERYEKVENLHADMGHPPDGLSLDRIDNNRGYEPGNIRWTTQAEQNRNKRRGKRKRRRSTIEELCAYAARLAGGKKK